MPSQYATTIHARLKAAASAAGVPCSVIDSINPDDMVVSLVMCLARKSGAQCDELFDSSASTRSNAALIVSPGSMPSASRMTNKSPM